MIDARLSHYRITRKLGEGGMGVVYQALDERLGREVALKILPLELVSDNSARSRLLREAQLASTLNHPNICTVYSVEEADGQNFIVMELVNGRRLCDVIPSGGLTVSTTVRYGVEIAAALAHAHGRGVLHRDLKTSNVMITADGHVKVLDFGLAKRLEDAESAATTRSDLSLTKPGMIVGTLHALAPEVLRGQPADVPSDVWALGVVLFEMIAGHPPFQGRTDFEISAAVLRGEPRQLPGTVTAGFRSVIARCLEKEPTRRYQTAGEARAALEAAESSAAIPMPVPRSSGKRHVYAAVSIGVFLVAAAVFFTLLPRRQPQPQYEQLTNFADSVTSPALSPDGRMLAFIHGQGTFDSEGQIWVKLLPNGEPVQVTNDNLRKMRPIFSPDGSKIAYTGIEQWDWNVWTVPALGGTPSLWLPNASGLTWINNRQVLFSEITSGLYMKIVTADENRAGERDVYLPPTTEVSMAHHSHLSPDGKWVLVTEMDMRGWLPCRLVPFDGGGQVQTVGPTSSECTSAAWSPNGKWMYFSANTGNGFHLWRQSFPNGTPEQLTFGATEEEGIAVAPDGRSLITAIGAEQSSVYWHGPNGTEQITSQGYTYSPLPSPDGTKIFYLRRTGASRAFVAGELWAADLATGQNAQILPGFSVVRYDVSPDGKRIVFAAIDSSGKSEIWLTSLTHSSSPHRLTQNEAYRPFFAPNGNILYLSKQQDKDYVYRMKEDGTNKEKLLPDPVIYLLAVSPDGKELVAWVEQKSGDTPNVVVAYPTAGGKPRTVCTRCSATGPAYVGASILSWSPDQKFLYLRLELPGMHSDSTFAIPLLPGHALPALRENGFSSAQEIRAIPGVLEIPQREVFPGRDPSVYAFWRKTTQRNLYRVRMP